MTDSLPLRSVIVTGGASGIGLAAVTRLLDDGWRVTAADIDVDALTSAHAHAHNESLLVQPVDVSNSESVTALYAAATARFGGVSAVANVAGISLLADQKLENLADDDFDRVIAVNLRGTFLMSKNAIAALRAQGGGSIVNVGSIASLRGFGGSAYVSSKHGILGLSRTVAYQYASENIRCNVVAPGSTQTPMLDLVRQKSVLAAPSPNVIAGAAEPSEVAGLIAYLLSPEARFINGATFTIDGGLTQY
ncbi:MAG: short-chain dehydrogenase/reductase [Frankiales bacterium]|nr:short-chain dehydrogenase/reductase [Frankiales bacterium]